MNDGHPADGNQGLFSGLFKKLTKGKRDEDVTEEIMDMVNESHEQGGIRPVLIIQNDTGNRHSPTVICAAITSKMNKAKLPTHVEIDACHYDIVKDSVILLEQLRTIDKKRLKDKVCHLDNEIINQVDKALRVSLEMNLKQD